MRCTDIFLHVIVLLPGLAAHGGIQRHNRTLCKVFDDFTQSHSVHFEVVSLHDPENWYDSHYLSQPVQGCNGNRALFVKRAFAALSKPHDLVVVSQIDFGPITLLPYLIRQHIPIVMLTYGIEVWQPLPIYKRAGLKIADRIVTISEYTAKKLVSAQHVVQNVVQIIPCTMDLDFLDQVQTWRALGQANIHTHLLTISRMSQYDADKGIDHVIAALPAVRAFIPDVSYTIIGDGADRLRLEKLACDLGVADSVHFAGRVPDEQLHAYLSGTDIFVMPSRKEGFGIVFLEAMAYSKPVIAGAHGGTPEVVIDGETGLLVQHGDKDALTNAITALLLDPARRQQMGSAGLDRVQNVYNYDSFRASFTKLLDELLYQ